MGQNLEFEVSIPQRGDARGLYLRDATEVEEGQQTYSVKVKPLFEHGVNSNERSPEQLAELLETEIEFDLKATEPWLTPPKKIALLSGVSKEQSFALSVDTSSLPVGAHFARVQGEELRGAMRLRIEATEKRSDREAKRRVGELAAPVYLVVASLVAPVYLAT